MPEPRPDERTPVSGAGGMWLQRAQVQDCELVVFVIGSKGRWRRTEQEEEQQWQNNNHGCVPACIFAACTCFDWIG